MSAALGLLAVFVLTAGTGYFVAQEFAYVSADRGPGHRIGGVRWRWDVRAEAQYQQSGPPHALRRAGVDARKGELVHDRRP
ncbi:hypothetical protein ABZ883_39650 [Streptomyces sp. NPDC046977]|uniref:hypothetical protein n=1 Tax=Streptomyces sp. NPDC046977 TaxID=3154703 RepID=UPI0033E3610C